MNVLFSLIKKNFKPPTFKWIIIILLPFVIISGYGVHKSINQFRQTTSNSKEFQKSEIAKFGGVANYVDYSHIGFDVTFQPKENAIFFTNPAYMNGLYAKINSLATLEIKKNCMGKEIRRDPSFNLRLSDIVTWLFSLAGLLLGWEAVQNREFLKSLAGRRSRLKLFLSIVLSRFILLVLCLAVLLSCMAILLLVENVGLANVDFNVLGVYPVVTLIILLFFPILGMLAGYIRWKMIGIPLLVLTWVFFVLLVPIITGSFSAEQSGDIPSSYKVYCDKLKVFDDFEKQTEEKYGKFNKDDMDTERKIVEDFWEHVYPQVEALDRDLLRLHEEDIKKHHRASVLTPVTFHNITCNELSSRGDRNFLAFFESLIRQKKGFSRHWIDQVYYKDPKKLVNFIKGDENIFQGKSLLPFYFASGLLVNLGWILLAAGASYYFFTRYLYHMKPSEITRLGDVKIEEKTQRLSPWFVNGDTFLKMLFNLLSGKSRQMAKNGFSGNVIIKGKNIANERNREDFLYIFRPEHLPVFTTVKQFLFLYADLLKLSKQEKQAILEKEEIKPIADKPMEKLKNMEKFEVLFALTWMKRQRFYLVDNIAEYLPQRFVIRFKERMEELVARGSLVFYLADDETVDLNLAQIGKCFCEGSNWNREVERQKTKIDMRAKIDNEQRKGK